MSFGQDHISAEFRARRTDESGLRVNPLGEVYLNAEQQLRFKCIDLACMVVSGTTEKVFMSDIRKKAIEIEQYILTGE